MKILHLSSESTWRGGEQQIGYLVKESLKLGLNPTIACRANSKMELFCRSNNLSFKALPFKSAYDLPTIMKIKSIFRNEGFDILHMHTSKGHTLGVIAGLFGLEAKMVLSRRVDFPIKNNLTSRFKYNYHGIKKIACISSEIKRVTATDIKDESRLAVIHSGVDTDRFQGAQKDFLRERYGLPDKVRLVGNTSALADHKDYFTFIDTAEIVLNNQENVHFFIIGDGPLRTEISEYISSKGLEQNITMTGFLDNIIDVLPSLDLFLFTSKTEGLGTSILDAFAAQVPVVATRAGGVPEMIVHRQTGMLSDVKDCEGLARNTLEVLKSASLRKDLIAGAVEKLRSFSKEAMAQNYMAIYDEILSAP